MASNFECMNTEVAFIPITTLDANGDVVPAIAGDTWAVAGSDATKATMTVDVMPSGPNAGAAAIKIMPLMRLAPGLIAKVTDTDNLTEFDLTIDIVEDTTPHAVGLNTAGAVFVPQAAPAA